MNAARYEEIYAISVKTGRKVKLKYTLEDMIGVGTFGKVYRIKTADGMIMAFKEQKHSSKTKFREITMSLVMTHQNLVKLFYYKLKRNKFCLTFMDYMPANLSQIVRNYSKAGNKMPLLKQSVYMFQLLRGLAFMHRRDIAHRDIKSDNIVVNDDTSELKICDFGSAKVINDGTRNQSYICSRWYRAPELLMGSNKYSVNIDLWSAGCILVELVRLEVCFEGRDSFDQLIKYAAKLGPPSASDLAEIEPRFNMSFLHERSSNDETNAPITMKTIGDPETYKFLFRLLQYNPAKRISAWDALFHPYFAGLRSRSHFADGKLVPPLYNWTPEEKKLVQDDWSQEEL